MGKKICPKCSNNINDSAKTCPYCFYSFSTSAAAAPEKTPESTDTTDNEYKFDLDGSSSDKKPQETKPQTTVPPVQTSATVTHSQNVTGSGSTPNPERTKKKGGSGIIIVVVILLFVIGFLGTKVVNGIRRIVKTIDQNKTTAATDYYGEEEYVEEEPEELVEEVPEAPAFEEEAPAYEEEVNDFYADVPYASEFIFPDSNARYLDESEVWDLDYATLRLAINEIYARWGYTFSSDELRAYFGSKSWYVADPSLTDQQVVFSKFNDFERKNIDLLSKYRDMKK